MRCTILYLIFYLICTSLIIRGPASLNMEQNDDKAIQEKQKTDLQDLVRGMNAAVADIAVGRIWVLFSARACSCPSDSESALQMALKAELSVSPDYELIDGQWPSIPGKQYSSFVSHAALNGYNDVMWDEIEHRYGKGTRQRVEKRASEMNPSQFPATSHRYSASTWFVCPLFPFICGTRSL
jgi:hypothetical protein